MSVADGTAQKEILVEYMDHGYVSRVVPNEHLFFDIGGQGRVDIALFLPEPGE